VNKVMGGIIGATHRRRRFVGSAYPIPCPPSLPWPGAGCGSNGGMGRKGPWQRPGFAIEPEMGKATGAVSGIVRSGKTGRTKMKPGRRGYGWIAWEAEQRGEEG